jgi:FtsH-binding integral membrane protein
MNPIEDNAVKNEDNFEGSNQQGQTSYAFVVSLTSFLMLFVLPFSLTFWPLVVIVIVASLFGVVMGHRILSPMKKTSSSGKGLTVVGLVLGYIALVFSSLWLTLLVLWLSGTLSIF